MEDVLGWVSTLRQFFFDRASVLTVTGNYGIIQNVKKFKWGRQEIEFVVFWVRSLVDCAGFMAFFLVCHGLLCMQRWIYVCVL